jgi:gamma-glutamylcyclotransferase (GGCT)/AIG2-like uncharacterized protein YtfP
MDSQNMPDKVKILVYGTLRKGQYNFDRIINNYGSESMKYIETKVIEGFKMVSISDWYPVIIFNGWKNQTIVVEVMEVSSEAKSFIDRMEVDAGYTIKQVDGMDIYCFVNDYFGNKGVIESGDWVKYISSK